MILIGYIILLLYLVSGFTPVIGYSDFSLEKLDAYIDQLEAEK